MDWSSDEIRHVLCSRPDCRLFTSMSTTGRALQMNRNRWPSTRCLPHRSDGFLVCARPDVNFRNGQTKRIVRTLALTSLTKLLDLCAFAVIPIWSWSSYVRGCIYPKADRDYNSPVWQISNAGVMMIDLFLFFLFQTDSILTLFYVVIIQYKTTYVTSNIQIPFLIKIILHQLYRYFNCIENH